MNGLWSTGFLVVLAVGLSAQTPQTPPKPAAQPTFRVTVDLVTNDIVVRDEKGNFVPDLKQNEFSEFGSNQTKPLPLLSLRFVGILLHFCLICMTFL